VGHRRGWCGPRPEPGAGGAWSPGRGSWSETTESRGSPRPPRPATTIDMLGAYADGSQTEVFNSLNLKNKKYYFPKMLHTRVVLNKAPQLEVILMFLTN